MELHSFSTFLFQAYLSATIAVTPLTQLEILGPDYLRYAPDGAGKYSRKCCKNAMKLRQNYIQKKLIDLVLVLIVLGQGWGTDKAQRATSIA